MEKIILKRVFLYKGNELSDIDRDMSEDKVLEHYSNIYPELINSVVEQKEIKNDKIYYEFKSNVGTKG